MSIFTSRVPLAAALMGGLFLSACDAQSPASQPPESFDILRAARPVPVVAAQAMSLQERVTRGMTYYIEGPELEMATLLAEDFEGQPFVYLNFTAPAGFPSLTDDPWAFGLSLTGAEWEGHTETSAWSTGVVGASTARATHTSSSVGVQLLRDLSRTVQAMGGTSSLKRIVAASSAIYLLEDQQGRFWDVETATLLDAEALQGLRDDYATSRELNNSPEMLQTLEESWDTVLAQDDGPGGPPGGGDDPVLASLGGRMGDYTRPDGSLDLGRAAQVLRLAPPSTRSALDERTGGFVQHCTRFLWWTTCLPTREGFIDEPYQAHGKTTAQRPYYFSQPGEGFRMSYCGTYNYYTADAPLGCAPASFVSLVWKQWKDGEPLFGRSYNWEQRDRHYQPTSIAVDLTAPAGTSRVPLIAQYMNSCYIFGGTMTTAGNFLEGSNRFLREHGKQNDANAGRRLRMVGNSSRNVSNLANSFTKANMLVQQIGQKRNPVIAEYWRSGFLQGHYSPVKEYRIVSFSGYMDVRVKTLDDKNGWFSISDPWLPEVGVFYLERY